MTLRADRPPNYHRCESRARRALPAPEYQSAQKYRAPSNAIEEVLAGIGERCDAIVQPTSGGGVGMSIEQRARVVTECRPEMATFNCGSFNFPASGSEFTVADAGGNDGGWLQPWMLPNTITCDDRPPVVPPPAPSEW